MKARTEQSGLTAKELMNLTDAMDNEEMLIRLCTEGAVSCRSEPLCALLADLARSHMDTHNGLLQTLSVRAQNGAAR